MNNDTYPNEENEQEINLPDQSNVYDPNSVLTYDDSNPQNPVGPDTDETELEDESTPSDLEDDSVPDQPSLDDSEVDPATDDAEAPSYDINPNPGQIPGDNQQGNVDEENSTDTDSYNPNLDKSGV